MAKGNKNIVAFDPMANKIFDEQYKLPIKYADTLESLVSQADDLVLLTSWPEFKQNKKLITSKRLFDLRYAFAELPKTTTGEKNWQLSGQAK
jgi:UDPglucose 6-dehydrogenase